MEWEHAMVLSSYENEDVFICVGYHSIAVLSHTSLPDTHCDLFVPKKIYLVLFFLFLFLLAQESLFAQKGAVYTENALFIFNL